MRFRGYVLQTFSALHFRDYRLLWIGNLATQVTLWMQALALGWLALELTDSPFFLGLLGFARGLPTFTISLLGGVLADRWDRRRLLIVCQGGLLLNAAVLAVLVAVGWIRPWHVLANGFLFGALMAINTPTRQALTANQVSQASLMNAIALHFAAQSAMRILGPFLAGRLIELVGITGSFALQSTLYIWAIAFFLRMDAPHSDRTRTADGIVGSLVEGLRYVKMNRVVLSLMVLAALLSFLGMPYAELLPVFARDVLGVGPSGLGMLLSAAGVGALIGTLALASLQEVRRKGLVLLGALGLFGCALMLLSVSRWFVLSVVLLACLGAAGVIFRTANNTLLQTASPDQLRGRVMGMESLAGGVTPFGSLLTGTVASLTSTPIAIGVGGVACSLSALALAIARSRVRRLR